MRSGLVGSQGGELTTGMTVADRRRLTGRPPNLDVAAEADVETFLARLVERIGALASAHSVVGFAGIDAAHASERQARQRGSVRPIRPKACQLPSRGTHRGCCSHVVRLYDAPAVELRGSRQMARGSEGGA